jgi:hypothetical protein
MAARLNIMWTTEKIQQYKKDWEILTNKQLSEKYNCSASSIRDWNYRLGLKRDKEYIKKIFAEISKKRKAGILSPGKKWGRPFTYSLEERQERERLKEEKRKARAEKIALNKLIRENKVKNVAGRPRKYKTEEERKLRNKRVRRENILKARELGIIPLGRKSLPKTETVKKKETLYQTKVVDRSKLHLHKIDSRTWIEVPKGASIVEMERRAQPVKQALALSKKHLKTA